MRTRFIEPKHLTVLEKAAIPADQAKGLGIWTVTGPDDLQGTGLEYLAAKVPGITGMVFTLRQVDGSFTYQMRVDDRHVTPEGATADFVVRKYVQEAGVGSIINVPESRAHLLDTAKNVLVVEGTKQTIAAALYAPEDWLVVGIQGILNWLDAGTPVTGLMRAVAGAERAVILPDADFRTKRQVWDGARQLRDVVATLVPTVHVGSVPGTGSTGLDDLLGSVGDLSLRGMVLQSILDKARESMGTPPAKKKAGGGKSGRPATVRPLEHQRPDPLASIAPVDLDDALDTYRRWMGRQFDGDAQTAVWAAVAAHRLTIDPVWLMVISGSGAGKTESIAPLTACGAHSVSAIASAGALLSGTSEREVTESASGGLLREIGSSGVLLIKDFTSTLTQSRDARAEVLAALREAYDGRWDRLLGTDGGKRLTWEGRLTTIAACTTAWDEHQAAVQAAGDRFLLVRIDSESPAARRSAGRQAMKNAGREGLMREELAAAAAGVLAGADASLVPDELEDGTYDTLFAAADLITRTRTAAITGFKGDIEGSHAPEAPTRLLKQLMGVLHGAMMLGLDEDDALRIALRVGADTLPPVRARILRALATLGADEAASPSDVSRLARTPRTTIDRHLEALELLEVVDRQNEEYVNRFGDTKVRWRYRLHAGIDPAVLTVTATGAEAPATVTSAVEAEVVATPAAPAATTPVPVTAPTPATLAVPSQRPAPAVEVLEPTGPCALCGQSGHFQWACPSDTEDSSF